MMSDVSNFKTTILGYCVLYLFLAVYTPISFDHFQIMLMQHFGNLLHGLLLFS